MELALARQYPDYYTYNGEAEEIKFDTVASGATASMIKGALETWVSVWKVTPVHLIIEDEPAFGLFGIDLARKYRIYFLVHGSPILPAAAWVALVAAIGVLGAIWLVGTFTVDIAYWGAMGKRYEVLQKVDPEKIPEVAAAMDKTMPKRPTPPSVAGGLLGTDIGEVIKWGVLGVAGFLAVSMVKEFRR